MSPPMQRCENAANHATISKFRDKETMQETMHVEATCMSKQQDKETMQETMHVEATCMSKQQDKNSIGTVASKKSRSSPSQCRLKNNSFHKMSP